MNRVELPARPRFARFAACAIAVMAVALFTIAFGGARAEAWAATLSVYTQQGLNAQTRVLEASLSDADLQRLAAGNETPEGGYMFNDRVIAVGSYATIDQILLFAGVSFGPDDTLVVSAGGSSPTSVEFTYDDVLDATWFYPNYDGANLGDTTGAISVPGPAIALSWGRETINQVTIENAQQALEAARANVRGGQTRFVIGASGSLYASGNLAGWRMPTAPTSLVVVKPAAPDPGPAPTPDPAPSPNPAPGPTDAPDLSVYVDLGVLPGQTPHWIVESGIVSRALSLGIMNGYADPATGELTGYFGPDDLTTRGQAARILYNMAHANGLIADDSYYESRANRQAILAKFGDVDIDAFYASAVAWACDMGILHGYGDGTLFGPADNLTREQYATIAYRFARVCGADLSGAGASSFASAPDAAEVSTWAADAMGWCAANKIITGVGATGVLNPAGTATRAEICKISVLALDAISAQ